LFTCRVLIVDDNRDAAESLERLVNAMGHDAISITDPSRAMEAARSHKPQLIFLDLGMPVKDGYEIADLLRKEFQDEVRIVALTGYGDAQTRWLTAKLAFDAHLLKPADAGLIEATIDHLCNPAKKRPPRT
jgi:CheY-like chemotaxis protein